MPKPNTFPTLYDDVLQIKISELKQWGYLQPDQYKSGAITWSRNEYKRGSISIYVNTLNNQHYIELDYKYGDQPRNYRIDIVSIPSNLGIGVIWYFICPQTNKRCRKLYSIDGYFLHREAFKSCMYESQTWSKKVREIDKYLRLYYAQDKLYEELYRKNFKRTYAGKPTKRYFKILKQLKESENISSDSLKTLISHK